MQIWLLIILKILRMRPRLTYNQVNKELRKLSNEEKRKFLPKFFKTGKGEYGEGDKFLGVVVPDIKEVAAKHSSIEKKEITKLLYSQWHEERFCGWLIVLNNFNKSKNKQEWYQFTLKNIKQINNWDLVDKIAPSLIGIHLEKKPQKQFLEWSSSSSLWVRRIAIMSTWPKIKNNEFNLTLKLAKKYLKDPEDLIHKATGWMLREIGKRDEEILLDFMKKNHKNMPRIMVSYALERVDKEKKQQFMVKSSRKID